MGQSAPEEPEISEIPAEVYICSYNKYSFKDKLDVIRDAHEVSQYYASLLLLERLPIKLDIYKNYSDHTEEYFNPTRKNVLTDLNMSYYKFYQYINSIPELYEKTDMTESDRRKLLTDIFNKCYIVQKYIIEDLWDDCNGQGDSRVPSQNSPQQVEEVSVESESVESESVESE
jgi:hypothetical protein